MNDVGGNDMRYSYPVTAEIEISGRPPFGAVLRHRPGTVLVGESGGAFGLVPAGRAPRHVTAVAEVSLRVQTVVVTRPLPLSPDHVVVFAFGCRVNDPVLLLRFGCWDVEPVLARYLREDPVLDGLLESAGPAPGGRAWKEVAAHARRRDRFQPPFVPGMTCNLSFVELDHRPRAEPEPAEPEPAKTPQDYIWDE
ncbi:hypothetical protein [Actinoplanes sp. NPDC049265]|uniref:hypothetical protein n=1 Tax=Actinoplanes sp. NPDC049265 TaxID=3363902 RepID=UPI003716B3B5